MELFYPIIELCDSIIVGETDVSKIWFTQIIAVYHFPCIYTRESAVTTLSTGSSDETLTAEKSARKTGDRHNIITTRLVGIFNSSTSHA
jgi:hypothetical protein